MSENHRGRVQTAKIMLKARHFAQIANQKLTLPATGRPVSTKLMALNVTGSSEL
jgi:hypothetical protein